MAKNMQMQYAGGYDSETEQYEMMEARKKKMAYEYVKGYAIAVCVLPEGEFTVKKIPLEYANGEYMSMMESGMMKEGKGKKPAKKSGKMGAYESGMKAGMNTAMQNDYPMAPYPKSYDSIEAALKGVHKMYAEYYPMDSGEEHADMERGYAGPNNYGTRSGKGMTGTPHPSRSGPSMHGARGGENKWGSRGM